eukprot:CAMPEP_0179261898 /NCGR_PEP_ID=MMETSP0797-20121207/27095_1 /TAXON_ID=47934 /ORGANISM="Dinophysis acuminata, Strain DAEP01" /LENGTH=106 /DNA_ID=CAMNT_0020970029 /DNA_START=119 /DNA_END=437 /DNA_ORIENTATION=-
MKESTGQDVRSVVAPITQIGHDLTAVEPAAEHGESPASEPVTREAEAETSPGTGDGKGTRAAVHRRGCGGAPARPRAKQKEVARAPAEPSGRMRGEGRRATRQAAD